MTTAQTKIGIIGGTGWLGGAIAKRLLSTRFLEPVNLWLSNRTGKNSGFESWPLVNFTTDNDRLSENCNVIILSVRPQDLSKIKANLKEKQIISVMAGVTVEKIKAITFAEKIIRSIPNSATSLGLSYTPWFASNELAVQEINFFQKLFETFGIGEQVNSEDFIDLFTALTGSGEGWIAFFEECLIKTGVSLGLNYDMSSRAIRQLFLGMGALLAKSDESMENIIKVLIDYAGTTAAGLTTLQKSSVYKHLENAIHAAHSKAKSDLTRQDD